MEHINDEHTGLGALAPVAAAMLLRSLAGGGGAIQQVVICLAAELDPGRVKSAWESTVGAAEALQTGFVIRAGDPIGLTRRPPLETVRIENEGPGDLEGWLAEDLLRPLPLETGTPWRCVFWPGERLWVWTFHHALLDGRSITDILRAFRDRLEDTSCGERIARKEWIGPDAAQIESAGAFYQSAFARLERFALEFPDDVAGPRGAFALTLGSEVADALEMRSCEMDVSAPAILTWAWGQAAALTAGLDAVAIGQVRAGAPQDRRAGFSMNTLPVVVQRCRNDDPGPEIRNFRVGLHRLRAIENVSPDDLSGVDFARHGGPWRGGVVMVERGTLAMQVGIGGAMTSLAMRERSSEPLLACARLRPELELEVEYDGRTHGPAAARTLLDTWAAIIMAVARGESNPVRLPSQMRSQLAAWEDGGKALARQHLARAWAESVARHADQVALVTANRSFTYADLNHRVDDLAARLEMSGISTGDVVASELDDRAWFPVVLLATARLGAIHVPLDPDLPEARRVAIVADSRPLLRITDFPENGERYGLPPMVLEWNGAQGRVLAPAPDDPDATLAILYTSGSTGAPKGVQMVHGGVCNEAIAIGRLAGIGPGVRLLQFASPGFDASLEEVLCTLLTGGTLVPRPAHLKTDILAFHEFIFSENIGVLDLSTAHWAAWCSWMVAEGKTIPTNVVTTIIGGERASGAALDEWFQANGACHRLLNTYGPTEASVVATVEVLESRSRDPVDPPIGKPLPGVRARVVGFNGESLPLGAAGELWLGGDCIGPGYWECPERTAAKFLTRDGCRWYRTGDRACWLPSGRLRFLGRIDDQLKIRGNRIEPAEVMRILEGFPGVSATHVGPRLRSDGSVALAAWIRWASEPPADWPAVLATHAAANLPNASVPTRWCRVETFVLSERGKIDRANLPEPDRTAGQNLSGESPATPTERTLAGLWCELLDLPEIHRDESFFDLGGDSITALKLFARIHRMFGLRLPLALLLDAPTLRLLGQLVDNPAATWQPIRDARAPVVQTLRAGEGEPLFCLHGGDGGVLFYRDFSRSLATTRRVVALESPALSSASGDPASRVEEIAADYLAAIREHQPTGRYHLLGYSFGGLLAYEIASQLRAAGESVAWVGLVDTLHPEAPLRAFRPWERAAASWNSIRTTSLARRLCRFFARVLQGVATHLRVRCQLRAARREDLTEPHSPLRLVQIREAHLALALAYRPRPLEGTRVILFRSELDDDKFEMPADYGWSDTIKQLETARVLGRHLEIFESVHVPVIAHAVSRLLEAPDPP